MPRSVGRTSPPPAMQGATCSVPTEEEQVIKRAQALEHLQAYIKTCGGVLPGGWACGMRFRLTTRRNGKLGLTTDNYYTSPCGATLRTHRQVAEFLGLQPAPALQQHSHAAPTTPPAQQGQQQQEERPAAAAAPAVKRGPNSDADDDPASFVSVTITRPGKRSHTVMLAGDSHQEEQQQQEEQDVQQQQQPSCTPALPLASPPAQQQQPQQPVAKRTKAAVVAKHAGGILSSGGSSSASTTSTCGAAAAVPKRSLAPFSTSSSAAASGMSSGTVGVQSLAHDMPPPPSLPLAARKKLPQQPQLRASLPQPSEQHQPAHSAASACDSACSSRAVHSSGPALSWPASTADAAAPANHNQQQQAAATTASSKQGKPRRPTWRQQLRELATQRAIERGILPARNNSPTPTPAGVS